MDPQDIIVVASVSNAFAKSIPTTDSCLCLLLASFYVVEQKGIFCSTISYNKSLLPRIKVDGIQHTFNENTMKKSDEHRRLL